MFPKYLEQSLLDFHQTLQLLPQLLMEQFDILPIQYRYIELMREGVWFGKIFFDKMTAKRT